MDQNNKILIVIDGSYFSYYSLFAAVRKWQMRDPNSYKQWMKPANETDQANLPNILNCPEFKKFLKGCTMKKLEAVDWVLKENHQDDFDLASRVDILFAMDDDLGNSFRKQLYAPYKAQRAVRPKQFKVHEARNYIAGVIFKELRVEEKYGYHLLKVYGAEGDDVIACALKNTAGYFKKFLIASDRDFLQLEGVEQYALDGKKVLRKTDKNASYEMTPSEYLLYKIILGDSSDNIQKVFPGCGPVRSKELALNKKLLKERLKGDQLAAKQFLMNKKLISFKEMPTELEDQVTQKVNEALYENETLNGANDFSDFMNW